jgi:putative addiction module component (TIGR02574 family)
MTEPMDRLENEALRLPPRDRAHLARLLLESLDAGEDPTKVAEAWEAEVARRVSEFRSGRMATFPSAEVIEQARAQIRKQK